MAYRNEPSLEELITGSINKKKSVKKNVIKAKVKENTRSFRVNIDYSKNQGNSYRKEIGDEFIDKSQFRNSRGYTSNNSADNDSEGIDPDFLRSLQRNFGNTKTDQRGRMVSREVPYKTEYKIQVPDEYDDYDGYDDYNEYDDYDDYQQNDYYDKRKNRRNNYEEKHRAVKAPVKRVSKSQPKKNSSSGNQPSDNNRYKDNKGNKRNTKHMNYEEVPKKKKRILPRLLLVLFIILAILAGIAYLYIDKLSNLFNYVPTGDRLDIQNVVSDEKVTNILLIGSDTRTDGSLGRSDSIMLISIRNDTKQIVMSSFMRDMYVQIPGQDSETWHKINWAHSKGGPELLMDTIEFNFGIEIDNYISVDFERFVKIVDAFGGVQLTVTDAEASAMNISMPMQNKLFGNPDGTDYIYAAGSYHMNGNQALAYTRIRKNAGDDFARTGRQREVIGLLISKAKSMEITKLNKLAEEVLPLITTNMEKSKLKSLMTKAPILLGYEQISQRVPYGDNGESWKFSTSTSDGSIIMPDFELNKKLLMDTIYGK
ncbi:MAG: LCP family protein [Clostridiales bacterium]|nr:LCP family protein [Clostridiales bacterium]